MGRRWGGRRRTVVERRPGGRGGSRFPLIGLLVLIGIAVIIYLLVK